MLNSEQIQIYNPLKCNGMEKVVQLEFENSFYLLFGGVSHANILGAFLMEKKIDYDEVRVDGFLIPVPMMNEVYEVLGAGKGYLYFDKKLYTGMNGSSRDYKVGINELQSGFLKKTLQSEGWTCF